jgi:hypothetical protein
MHTIVSNYGLWLMMCCVPCAAWCTMWCVGHSSDALSISPNLRDTDTVYSILIILYCALIIISSSLYILHSTSIILSPTNQSAHRDLCSRELEYDQRKNNIGKIRTLRSLNYIYIGLSVHRNTGVQKRTKNKTGRDLLLYYLVLFYFILFYLNK